MKEVGERRKRGEADLWFWGGSQSMIRINPSEKKLGWGGGGKKKNARCFFEKTFPDHALCAVKQKGERGWDRGSEKRRVRKF